MIQLILHLVGDYVTQSDWMAQNKTKSSWAAFCHATVYALPFLAIASVNAWLVIWLTHLVIDRFRLARYVVYAKNWLAPRSYWHPWLITLGASTQSDFNHHAPLCRQNSSQQTDGHATYHQTTRRCAVATQKHSATCQWIGNIAEILNHPKFKP